MTSINKILEIYKSDWQEAIADAAYFMTANSEKSRYLDQYETVRDMRRFKELVENLDNFDSTKAWEEYMNILATRAARAYVKERATGNFLSGTPMTFIGHASHTFIDWGFLGYIAYTVDNGDTEKSFTNYVSIDTKFSDAVHSGDYETATKLADEWSLSMAAVEEAYEKLYTLLGLKTE